jgi:hypothetical protein
MNPMGPGLIGGRCNHSATAGFATDHHRPAPEPGIYDPLHGDKKGIQINVKNFPPFIAHMF